jgi:hypothetical protein
MMKLNRPGESEVILSRHGPLIDIVYVAAVDRIDCPAYAIP